MSKNPTFTQKNGRRIVALAAVTGLYFAARLPQLPDAEREQIAGRYHFTGHALPEIPGHEHRTVRAVHPSLQHICSWISSVGAAVALNDIDGDGLPNDVCYVDPRTDLVTVAPVPGTPARYAAFDLNPAPLPYDPATMAPMGTLPGDYNEDGLEDVLVYYWGRTPVLFLRTSAGAPLSRASYVARELAPKVERWFTNCATLSDLDGDGHTDLIIGNYFPDGADILNAHGTGVQSMQHSMSNAFNGGTKRLLLWAGGTGGDNPSASFNDQSAALPDEISHGWTLALGTADLDGDMLPEIYFANDFGPDRLMHNRSTPGHLSFALLHGRRELATPKSKVLGDDSFKGMGVDFADINGDGLLDIYVSNIAGEFSLEESHFVWESTGEVGLMKEGIAPYVDRSENLGLSRSSWSWDTRFGDFNNDGTMEALQATGFVRGEKNKWPELHELATSNDQLLSNPGCWLACRPGDDLSGRQHVRFNAVDHRGHYYDISEDVGTGRTTVTRGIATADVDGDGLLDFAAANQWDTSYFYHNESRQAGRTLGLHLRLPVGSGDAATVAYDGAPRADVGTRAAIGAQAVIHLPGGRKLVAQVDGGNGHSGKRSADLQFGLGDLSADTPIRADISWRDPHGTIHHQTMNFRSGWHTVVLGSTQNEKVAS
jgi:hypothetical protein